MPKIAVRPTELADIPALIALQQRVYPSITPWSSERFTHQIEVFPQGQLVATDSERIVGCASSLVVQWDEWSHEHSWREITTQGTFDNHDIQGRTLYGAEVFVDPSLRGMRVGHALYEGRRRLCKMLNLRRIIACGRLPGYHRYASHMSVTDYCKRVLWGDINDPVLSFQLREGFRYCGVIEHYIPQDHESGGYASLIVWLNTRYNAKKPSRLTAPTPLHEPQQPPTLTDKDIS